MTDPLLNLDIKNDRTITRLEAASLIPPEDLVRGAFEPLPDDDDLDELRDRGVG
jgi:hypothetical protein